MKELKILSADECKGVFVETDDEPWSDYRRWGPDNWEVRMGESWEPHYACEEIEAAYQAWNTRNSVMEESDSIQERRHERG